MLAAQRIRSFELQLAALEQAPWAWLGEIAGQMAFPLVVGTGLCFLLPSARIGSNFFSVFLTFTVHLGFLPAIYILGVINSKSARRVLKPDYKAIREATPDQDFGLWIGVFVVGVVVLLGILFTMDSERFLG